MIQRPKGAFLLSFIASILTILGAFAVLGFVRSAVPAADGMIAAEFQITLAIGGVVAGIIETFSSVMLYRTPEKHRLWGILIILVSIFGWFGAAGGFIIGSVYGLVGGVLALRWKPSTLPESRS